MKRGIYSTNRLILRMVLLTAVAASPLLAQGRLVISPKDTKLGSATAILPRPQLGAAIFGPSSKAPTIGGSDLTIYDGALSLTLAWKSVVPASGWTWQVTDQPFPAGDASLSPPGLLSAGSVSGSSFQLRFREFPPLGAAPGRQPARAAGIPRGGMTYYVRIIPVKAGQTDGMASNTVIVHYTPGVKQPNMAGDAIAAAAKADALAKLNDAALSAAYATFSMDLVSFTPAIFPDPNRWGCVYLEKNPYFNKLHPLSTYKPGMEHCPHPLPSSSYQASGVWDYVGGWAKAYEGLSGFYDGIKSWVASKIASAIPCNLLPKSAAQDCESAAKFAAESAISAALVVAGVPPSLPSFGALEEAARGKLADAAMEFTCEQVEANGGVCTPEMKTALKTAYNEGMKQLVNSIKTSSIEPGCDNAAEAKDNGRLPLPCFSHYPDVLVKPAKGAMYEPPQAVVRVTRIKPSPKTGAAACQAHLSMWVTNHYGGGVISGLNVKPTALSGTPFASVSSGVPALSVGQSVDVAMVMATLNPFVIPGHLVQASPGWSKDWLALYGGGSATVSAALTTFDPGAKKIVSCSASSAQKTLTLP